MNFSIEILLLLIALEIELSATDDSRLCAEPQVLAVKKPQLSDCVLTWIKRIPENIDEYCVTSKDLEDFCSRLDKYKKEMHDSECSAFRSNIDHWVECMAYYNFKQQSNCRDGKCSKIALYSAIPNCNTKIDLSEYQNCMEEGTEAAVSLIKERYFGVPTYLLMTIVVLCLVIFVLLIVYKTEQRRRKKKNDSLDMMGSASVSSSTSTTSISKRAKSR